MTEKIQFTFKAISHFTLWLWDEKWILQIFTSWEVSLKKVKIVVQSLGHKNLTDKIF